MYVHAVYCRQNQVVSFLIVYDIKAVRIALLITFSFKSMTLLFISRRFPSPSMHLSPPSRIPSVLKVCGLSPSEMCAD